MKALVRDVVDGLRDTVAEYQMAGWAKRLVQSQQMPDERLCAALLLYLDPG